LKRSPASTTTAAKWLLAAAVLAGLLLLGIVAIELRAAYPAFRMTLSGLDWRKLASLVSLLVVLAAGGFFTLLGLAEWLLLPASKSATQRINSWLVRLGKFNLLLAFLVACFPVFFLLLTDWGAVFTGSFTRLILLACTVVLVSVFISRSATGHLHLGTLLASVILISGIYVIAQQLALVTAYPFAMSWSEGNRFYDYSVVVDPGRYVYPGDLKLPYYAPGRYILWGLPYLIPGSTIWLHRLWNALLWTIPCILFGLLLARWTRFNRATKWFYALWVLVFLTQGPIYPPLVFSAMIVVLTVRPGRWLLSLLGTSAASYYAALSRWTWLPAGPTWAGFLLLDGFEIQKGEKWTSVLRRLLPIAFVALVGLAFGALANPTLVSPQKLSKNTALSQPLLWHRLLPNPTYPDGILLALALATLPLVILLAWAVYTRRWRLNWLQILAYSAAPLVLLAMGIVASVKIGGGSNLHNLDMLLVSLLILCGLMLRGREFTEINLWPNGARILLSLAVIIPAWNALRDGLPLQLPANEAVQVSLTNMQKRILHISQGNDALFIDQRQLLTFGYLTGITLVPEYEKKYMMDQAMAGNQPYFQQFYQDLANQRFKVIVTEPIFLNADRGITPDAANEFSEEDQAWVKWVSKPLLCYYQPLVKYDEVRVQLLIPRPNPQNCLK
jgi:hypothetical protein